MSKPVGLLYTGNALEVLRSMADESVQMCVTSPPYWGLRDYGICACRQDRVQHESPTLVGSQAGTPCSQAGTPSEFGAADPECAICNGSGRITYTEHIWGGNPNCEHTWISETVSGKSGGPSDKQKSNAGSWFAPSTCSTCSAWYGSLGNEPEPNLFIEHLVIIFAEVRRVLRGDGTLWVNIGDTYAANRSYQAASTKGGKKHSPAQSMQSSNRVPEGIKPKDLVGVPWMLAFALRADGWYLRQDIIWHKRNPMPESVKDRCVKGHEYVFLLSKSEKYYFDHIAIQEPAVEYAAGKRTVSLGAKSLSKGQATGANVVASGNGLADTVTLKEMRNKRSVWTMSSKPFKAWHFATFPEEIVTTPILAGTSEGGCCAECHKSYVRIIVSTNTNKQPVSGKLADLVIAGNRNDGNARMGDVVTETLGWKQQCSCRQPDAGTQPSIVLDPFSGAATTGKVALELGREYIGIEQSPLYNEIARKRLTDAGLDCEVL